MKYADRRLAPAAVMLGEDEIAAGQVTIKDLDHGRALAAGIVGHQRLARRAPGSADRAAREPRGGGAPYSGQVVSFTTLNCVTQYLARSLNSN